VLDRNDKQAVPTRPGTSVKDSSRPVNRADGGDLIKWLPAEKPII
jgi:hypothetical protein